MTSLFAELKRRNVFRVGIAYIVVAWLLAQVADLALENFGSPDWVIKTLLFLLALGFPLALFFAWAFELTPEGIKKEKEVDRSQSITPNTGRKLDRAIIAFLVLALAYFVFDKFSDQAPTPSEGEVVQALASPDEAAASADIVSPSGTTQLEKSVAVLPFRNLSANPEDEYFAKGMHDDLLTQLAKIGSMKVISRTSVMEYKDTTKKIPQIAQELGVATVLEGGVQRSGSRIRINAQLINAETDEHLWAETYNRELSADTLFDIQAEIALAIAKALQAALSPEEEARINRALTSNLEAWESYQRAVGYLQTQGVQSIRAGVSEVNRTLQLDPEFAAAWSLKAILLLQQFWFYDTDPALRESAWDAIQHGRSIDPTLPELDLAEGYYHYWGFRDYEKALPFMDKASTALPNDARAHSAKAYVLRRSGRWEETLAAMRRAAELDPRRGENFIDIAETLAEIHRFDEAGEALAMAKRTAPNSPVGRWSEANLLMKKSGDIANFSHLNHLVPPVHPGAQLDTWRSSLFLDDYEAALQDVAAWPDAFLDTKDTQVTREMLAGLTHRYAGNTEQAQPLLLASLQDFETRLEVHADNFAILRSLCFLTGGLGDLDATSEYCSKSLEVAPKDAFLEGNFKFDAAIGLALAGDVRGSLNLLDAVLKANVGPTINEVTYHPAFDGMREHPAYLTLLEKYGPK